MTDTYTNCFALSIILRMVDKSSALSGGHSCFGADAKYIPASFEPLILI